MERHGTTKLHHEVPLSAVLVQKQCLCVAVGCIKCSLEVYEELPLYPIASGTRRFSTRLSLSPRERNVCGCKTKGK